MDLREGVMFYVSKHDSENLAWSGCEQERIVLNKTETSTNGVCYC